MLKRAFLMGVLLTGISLVCAGGAKADTMGTLVLTGCGGGATGCPDATYNFDINPNGSATLAITIDSDPGAANIIEGVDLGFTASSNISNLQLAEAPAGDPATDWYTPTSSLSNSGCGTNSGAFICASAISPFDGVTISKDQTYTWKWTFDSIDQSLIATSDNVHVGANYDPGNGLIVSQTGPTSLPEPGTITLLFAGLLGLGLAGPARRRLLACS